MATKGKRIIFTDATQLLAQEAAALQADILPGMSVTQSATGYSKNSNASTVAGIPFMVADYDGLEASTVDDAWTISETMVARRLTPDKRANVVVATAQALTRDTPLASNGDGTLKIGTPATDFIVAYADEIVTTTAAQLVRVRGA